MKENAQTSRPDWFSGCWTEALNFAPRSHATLEAALGLGRLIEEGNIVEARRLYDTQIFPVIILLRMNPQMETELDSSQLQAMIQSGLYPEDLCEEAAHAAGISLDEQD